MTTATAQITGLALNFSSAGAPDWVQLTPRGPNIDGRDGRKWVLPNPEAVVAAFRNYGADLPIDIEHATQLKGAKGDPAPAVGWIKDMKVEDGALWGGVAWTEAGSEALASGAYRYLSPAFHFEKQTSHILSMTSAGLTNQPNLHLEALNSAGESEETKMDKDVLDALGLASDASATAVVVAINALKADKATALNSAQHPDSSLFVPRADHDAALNRLKDFEAADKTREDAAINAALDAATTAGKIAPASRAYHEATCRSEGGLKRFEEMIAAAPVIAANSGLDDKDLGKAGAGALSADELAVCHALGQNPEEFKSARTAENKE